MYVTTQMTNGSYISLVTKHTGAQCTTPILPSGHMLATLGHPMVEEFHALLSVTVFHQVILITILCNPQVALSGHHNLATRWFSGTQLMHTLHHFPSQSLHRHTINGM